MTNPVDIGSGYELHGGGGLFKGRPWFTPSHKDYNVDRTGTTDATTKLLNCIADAAAENAPVRIDQGIYLVSGELTENAAFPVFLEMAGRDGVTFKWNGADYGKVFRFTKEGSQIRGGCVIAPVSGKEGKFIGVSHEASRQTCHDVRVVYPNIGIQIDGRYGVTHVGFDIYQAQTPDTSGHPARGLNLINQANSNILIGKQCTGLAYSANSHGIHINGMSNHIVGNQLSQFDRGVYQDDGQANDIFGFFTEDNLINLQLTKGHLRFHPTGVAKRILVADDAILEGGLGVGPGLGFQRAPRVPFDCSAYYPLQQGNGTTLLDRSGNRRNATISGAASSSWVTGAFGTALQLAVGASIVIPAPAIDYTQPWTVALCCRPTSWYATGNQLTVLNISDGTNTITLGLYQATGNIEVRRNGTFIGNLAIPPYDSGDRVHVLVSYNPTTGVLTCRHPSMLGVIGVVGQSVSVSAPWTGAVQVFVQSSSIAGTTVYEAPGIATWQRELTAAEMHLWINQRAPALAVNALPRTYSASLTPASVAAQSVAEQTFTVSGLRTTDRVSVNPPATPNNIGICGARVSATDTLALRFVNPTAGALTPTAGTYEVTATAS